MTVTRSGLAVDRDYTNKATNERDTDFFDCLAWRQEGDFVAQYGRQGRRVLVQGRLHRRKYQTPDGQNRTVIEVVADRVTFLDRDDNKNGNGATANHPPGLGGVAATAPRGEGFGSATAAPRGPSPLTREG